MRQKLIINIWLLRLVGFLSLHILTWLSYVVHQRHSQVLLVPSLQHKLEFNFFMWSCTAVSAADILSITGSYNRHTSCEICKQFHDAASLSTTQTVARGDSSKERSFRVFTMLIWAIQIHAAPTLFQVSRYIPYFIWQISLANITNTIFIKQYLPL